MNGIGLSHNAALLCYTVVAIIGIILLVAGFLLKIHILWVVGLVLLVVGLVLMVMGRMGRAVGGRRHYY